MCLDVWTGRFLQTVPIPGPKLRPVHFPRYSSGIGLFDITLDLVRGIVL
jgi:hypothetical protein